MALPKVVLLYIHTTPEPSAQQWSTFFCLAGRGWITLFLILPDLPSIAVQILAGVRFKIFNHTVGLTPVFQNMPTLPGTLSLGEVHHCSSEGKEQPQLQLIPSEMPHVIERAHRCEL